MNLLQVNARENFIGGSSGTDLKFDSGVIANRGNNATAAPLETNSLIVLSCDVLNKISGENPAFADCCNVAKF